MAGLRFQKYEGLGNDFLVVDGTAVTEAEARLLCDRRFGVGEDGVLIVGPPRTPGARASMQVINADGSRPEMCGNGLRCVALHLAIGDRAHRDAVRARHGRGCSRSAGRSGRRARRRDAGHGRRRARAGSPREPRRSRLHVYACFHGKSAYDRVRRRLRRARDGRDRAARVRGVCRRAATWRAWSRAGRALST